MGFFRWLTYRSVAPTGNSSQCDKVVRRARERARAIHTGLAALHGRVTGMAATAGAMKRSWSERNS